MFIGIGSLKTIHGAAVSSLNKYRWGDVALGIAVLALGMFAHFYHFSNYSIVIMGAGAGYCVRSLIEILSSTSTMGDNNKKEKRELIAKIAIVVGLMILGAGIANHFSNSLPKEWTQILISFGAGALVFSGFHEATKCYAKYKVKGRQTPKV